MEITDRCIQYVYAFLSSSHLPHIAGALHTDNVEDLVQALDVSGEDRKESAENKTFEAGPRLQDEIEDDHVWSVPQSQVIGNNDQPSCSHSPPWLYRTGKGTEKKIDRQTNSSASTLESTEHKL